MTLLNTRDTSRLILELIKYCLRKMIRIVSPITDIISLQTNYIFKKNFEPCNRTNISMILAKCAEDQILFHFRCAQFSTSKFSTKTYKIMFQIWRRKKPRNSKRQIFEGWSIPRMNTQSVIFQFRIEIIFKLELITYIILRRTDSEEQILKKLRSLYNTRYVIIS